MLRYSGSLLLSATVRKLLAATTMLTFVIGAAHADQTCKAVAMHNVHANEDADSVLRKGQTLDEVTQFVVDKQTKQESICEAGGFCYSASALRLTNCRVNYLNKLADDDTSVIYSLAPVDWYVLLFGFGSADNSCIKSPSSPEAVIADDLAEGYEDKVIRKSGDVEVIRNDNRTRVFVPDQLDCLADLALAKKLTGGN